MALGAKLVVGLAHTLATSSDCAKAFETLWAVLWVFRLAEKLGLQLACSLTAVVWVFWWAEASLTKVLELKALEHEWATA